MSWNHFATFNLLDKYLPSRTIFKLRTHTKGTSMLGEDAMDVLLLIYKYKLSYETLHSWYVEVGGITDNFIKLFKYFQCNQTLDISFLIKFNGFLLFKLLSVAPSMNKKIVRQLDHTSSRTKSLPFMSQCLARKVKPEMYESKQSS